MLLMDTWTSILFDILFEAPLMIKNAMVQAGIKLGTALKIKRDK